MYTPCLEDLLDEREIFGLSLQVSMWTVVGQPIRFDWTSCSSATPESDGTGTACSADAYIRSWEKSSQNGLSFVGKQRELETAMHPGAWCAVYSIM